MAIDSIGNSGTQLVTTRAQSAASVASPRAAAPVINAVQQTRQRVGGATAPVKIFAVPQPANGAGPSGIKVPRGSLVDETV